MLQRVSHRDLLVPDIVQHLLDGPLAPFAEATAAAYDYPHHVALAQRESCLRRQDDLFVVAQDAKCTARSGLTAGRAARREAMPVGVAEKFRSVIHNLVLAHRTKAATMFPCA